MKVNEPRVQIEEVTSELTPAEGASIERALHDAKIMGADKVEVLNGKVLVTWFKRRTNG